MSTGSRKGTARDGEVIPGPPMHSTRAGCDPDLDQLIKDRQAEIQRIVARRKPELIQQGIEAYKRDLPRLLAENRYLQHVAYRGNEMVAIAASSRQLDKKLAKLGLMDMGELFTMPICASGDR